MVCYSDRRKPFKSSDEEFSEDLKDHLSNGEQSCQINQSNALIVIKSLRSTPLTLNKARGACPSRCIGARCLRYHS